MQKKYLKNLTRGLKGLIMLALITGLAYGGQRDARATGQFTRRMMAVTILPLEMMAI